MFRNSSGKTRWLLLFPAVVLVVLALVIARRADKTGETAAQAGTSPTRDASALAESTVTVAGRDYTLDPDKENILFIGVDDFGPAVGTEFYFNEGQADFLMLGIIDHTAGTYRMLPVNRDTMTEVTMLGLGGKAAGSDTMQLALAHCYGSGQEDSCRNTVEAVSRLFYGIRIDGYVAVNMDAVGILADAVGGVTLVCLDDFQGELDFFEGNTVVLKGDDALTYVRGRSGVADETNINRMERQKQFIDAFLKKYMSCASDDGFSLNALEQVSRYMVSDMTLQKMSDTAEILSGYTCTGMDSLAGESVLGADYMEFYPDTQALQDITIDCFCLPDN